MIVVSENKQTKEGISAIPYIFSHSYLHGYDGREDMAYRPVALSTFAIERSLFDADPTFSHLIQVLLYSLTVLVLFRLLNELFGAAKSKWTMAIALLFMVHPIHTEVVANVKSRDELLCALFLLLSLYFFIRGVRQANSKKMVAGLVVYFLALLSKETAAPAILLFPGMLWFFDKLSFKQTVLKTLPIIVPALVYIILRSLILSNVLIGDKIDPVSNNLVLAESAGQAFATNLTIFLRYVELSVLPFSMSWDYSINSFPLVDFGNWKTIAGLIFLLLLVGALIYGVVKRSLIGFGALTFISTFIATSNFIFLIFCVLGERFLFVPVLGVLLMLVPIVDNLLHKWNPIGAQILFGSVLIFYSLRTVVRNEDWRSNLSIYEAGVAAEPNSVKTHFNLGTEFITQANKTSNPEERRTLYGKSILSLERAFEIYPAYANLYENSAFVYSELSKLETDTLKKLELLEQGRKVLAKAIDTLEYKKNGLFINQSFILTQMATLEKDSLKRAATFSKIIQLTKKKPEYTAEDFHHETYALYSLRKYEELKKMVSLRASAYPEKADLMAEISRRLFTEGKHELSLFMLEAYLKHRPEDLSSFSNKGMLLEILGRKKEAKTVYEEILKKDPNQQHTKTLYDNLIRAGI
jgi:tetratricopeptide (TPR) repeat protein